MKSAFFEPGVGPLSAAGAWEEPEPGRVDVSRVRPPGGICVHLDTGSPEAWTTLSVPLHISAGLARRCRGAQTSSRVTSRASKHTEIGAGADVDMGGAGVATHTATADVHRALGMAPLDVAPTSGAGLSARQEGIQWGQLAMRAAVRAMQRRQERKIPHWKWGPRDPLAPVLSVLAHLGLTPLDVIPGYHVGAEVPVWFPTFRFGTFCDLLACGPRGVIVVVEVKLECGGGGGVDDASGAAPGAVWRVPTANGGTATLRDCKLATASVQAWLASVGFVVDFGHPVDRMGWLAVVCTAGAAPLVSMGGVLRHRARDWIPGRVAGVGAPTDADTDVDVRTGVSMGVLRAFGGPLLGYSPAELRGVVARTQPPLQ